MLNVALQRPNSIDDKLNEIKTVVKRSFAADVWNIDDPSFLQFGKSYKRRYVHFTYLNLPDLIQLEIKFFLAKQLLERRLSLNTILQYTCCFKEFSDFLNTCYPKAQSLIEIPLEKALAQWETFLIKNKKTYLIFVRNLLNFIRNHYDTRDFFEKDIWDARTIDHLEWSETTTAYLLNFTKVPQTYRNSVKRFIRTALVNQSVATLARKISYISYFLEFLIKESTQEFSKSLNNLARSDLEKYFNYLFEEKGSRTPKHLNAYISAVYEYLDFLHRIEHHLATKKPIDHLIFPEDFKKRQRFEDSIKFVPEMVFNQLQKLFNRDPKSLDPQMTEQDKKYIPIVILLMATGWRISDILNLRYHNCLLYHREGWYLQGDIKKQG